MRAAAVHAGSEEPAYDHTPGLKTRPTYYDHTPGLKTRPTYTETRPAYLRT